MTQFVNDDGEYLDFDGTDIPLSKQAVSFYKFELKGNFSVSFDIPNTSVNRRILGYYGANQIGGPAYSRTVFTMLRDGNPIERGAIIIEGSDKDNINIYFLSGNANWFNELKFNIKDINYEDYVVLMNDVDARKAADAGIVFPFVDWAFHGQKRGYSFCHTTGNSGIQEMFPCFYLHSLMKSISGYSNVKLAGSLFDDFTFKHIIVTPSGPELHWPEFGRAESRSYVKRGSNVAMTAATSKITFDYAVEQGAKMNYDTSVGKWTADKTCTVRVTLNLTSTVNQIHNVIPYVNGVTTGVNIFGGTNTFYSGFFYVNVPKGQYLELYMNGTGAFTLVTNSNCLIEVIDEIPAGFFDAVNATAPFGITNVPYVTPGAIVPDIKAVELMKWLVFYFGAAAYFDSYSNTLTITPLVNYDKTQSLNWSAYIVSYETDWNTDVAKNNRVQTVNSTEPEIKAYNAQALTKYGGGTITTDFDIEQENDLYEMPFSPSFDEANQTQLGWFLPYINFYDLEDDADSVFVITSVTNNGGVAQFDSTTATTMADNDVCRVVTASGEYNGYIVMYSTTPNRALGRGVNFTVNTTGTMIRQKIKSVDGNNRILFCLPGSAPTDAGGPATWLFQYASPTTTPININISTLSATSGPIAWFDKPKVNKLIDNYRTSLSIDNLPSRGYNHTIGDRYWSPLNGMFNSPKIRAKMLLPLSVYVGFNFDKFIFISTKDLNGYFFVNKISGYKDARSECDVELISVDG